MSLVFTHRSDILCTSPSSRPNVGVLSAQVRRPHASDEVVANLAKYNSTTLSADYLHDADQVVSR